MKKFPFALVLIAFATLSITACKPTTYLSSNQICLGKTEAEIRKIPHTIRMGEPNHDMYPDGRTAYAYITFYNGIEVQHIMDSATNKCKVDLVIGRSSRHTDAYLTSLNNDTTIKPVALNNEYVGWVDEKTTSIRMTYVKYRDGLAYRRIHMFMYEYVDDMQILDLNKHYGLVHKL